MGVLQLADRVATRPLTTGAPALRSGITADIRGRSAGSSGGREGQTPAKERAALTPNAMLWEDEEVSEVVFNPLLYGDDAI
jgi:hypothetical protein